VKRAVIAGATTAVVLAATLTAVHLRREQEWSHGGDDVTVAVSSELATPATLAQVAERWGAPPGEATTLMTAEQVFVVRVTWSGATPTGSFQVVALDARVDPPQILAADGGWAANGATGSNWSSAYEELASRYGWLRRVAAANYTDANGMNSMPTAAVGAPAADSGSVTAWFRLIGTAPVPLKDAAGEVIVALIKVDDDGEVRWARRVSG
jgi:hypothetical protein